MPRSVVSLSPKKMIKKALTTRDVYIINETIESMPLHSAVCGILGLTPKKRERVFKVLNAKKAAEILRLVPEVQAGSLIGYLKAETAANILPLFDSHQQVELLHDLDLFDAEKILSCMPDKAAERLRQLRGYEEKTAGGLMHTEYLSFQNDETVGAVFRRLGSERDEHSSDFKFYPYVVDDKKRLVGVLSILRLIGEPRSTDIASIMVPARTVHFNTSLEELDEIFQETNFFSLPVVDDHGILLGTVFHEVVTERMRGEAASDALKTQGIIGDEIRSMPLLIRSRRRLAWLSANIILNVIAASVISAYEETLSAVIAIAVFLPMVSDMSGCSGNQSVAVSLRELALGLIKPVDAFRVWLKEISVGAINGTILGILIAVVCWLWKGNPYLGMVIGLALALNTMIAVSIGGVVPLILKRFGTDPAVASGPLLTTITDMAGFFLVLSLAQLAMPLLIN
ncbi:magnesium transporter [Magnetococcales bacterium HHB-1]